MYNLNISWKKENRLQLTIDLHLEGSQLKEGGIKVYFRKKTQEQWNECIHEIQKKVKYKVYNWSSSSGSNVYSWNTAAAVLRPWPCCLLPLGQSDPSTSLNNHFGINKMGSGHNPRSLGFLESLLLILERGKTFGIRILDCDWFKSQHQEPFSVQLLNFKLKPWSRWGDFLRFDEHCKSWPSKQTKRKPWLQCIFKNLHKHLGIFGKYMLKFPRMWRETRVSVAGGLITKTGPKPHYRH